ncbi:MAG TPA: sigma-70 family RNA polymerase sigma factor [Acidimicrobiia bacterium]|nr:sigma-70 family RNA polymerase sigma factor [Acidimicrobiia bacterium]
MENGQDPEVARLIEDALPLVKHVMFQVSVRFPRHVDREELIRAGVLGLVQAAHRFDPTKGVNFNHYAAQRIRGAILDAVRSIDWAPRSVRRSGRDIEAAGDKLANDLGRIPTALELAAELGMAPTALAGIQHQLARSVVLGLEMVVSEVDGDDDEVLLKGTLPDPGHGPDEELVNRELHAYLRDAVDVLPERHRIVIQGYFFEGRTSEELAAEIGVTVSRVSQLRTEAFGMIREGLAAQYRDADVDAPEPEVAESKHAAGRRGAYAAAIAGKSTWRSRLDADSGRSRLADQIAV